MGANLVLIIVAYRFANHAFAWLSCCMYMYI
ncbi:MAG: hypothetical protein KatS3mg067_0916 [Thermosynechococcus sp.]|nr:MAG: hypothetical protein KatS3mg067_0916 [Thermosynechococcus sp.]